VSDALTGLHKAYVQIYGNIRTSFRCVGIGAPACGGTAENGVEYIAQVYSPVGGKAAETAAISVASRAAAVGRVYSRMSELVISRPFLRIGQYIVGLVYFLEFGFRFGIVGIKVGMVFFGKFTVGGLYFRLARAFF